MLVAKAVGRKDVVDLGGNLAEVDRVTQLCPILGQEVGVEQPPLSREDSVAVHSFAAFRGRMNPS